MVAALAGASVFLLSGALAAGAATPCAGSVLAGSNFEIDTNANLKVDGPADCIDWLADGSGSAMRAGVITKNDLPTGATDNSFGQGSQENDINPTVVTGSIPPNKSDLKTFGLYAEGATAPQFLELFWSRVQNPSGTTEVLRFERDAHELLDQRRHARSHGRRQADHVQPLERRYRGDDRDPHVGNTDCGGLGTRDGLDGSR